MTSSSYPLVYMEELVDECMNACVSMGKSIDELSGDFSSWPDIPVVPDLISIWLNGGMAGEYCFTRVQLLRAASVLVYLERMRPVDSVVSLSMKVVDAQHGGRTRKGPGGGSFRESRLLITYRGPVNDPFLAEASWMVQVHRDGSSYLMDGFGNSVMKFVFFGSWSSGRPSTYSRALPGTVLDFWGNYKSIDSFSGATKRNFLSYGYF